MELCVTEEMIGLEINLIITTVASKRNIWNLFQDHKSHRENLMLVQRKCIVFGRR